MKGLRSSSNIKLGLFFLAILIILGSLGYTNWLVRELREDNQRFLQYNARMLANALASDAQTRKYREERRQFLVFNANLYASALTTESSNLDFAFNEIIRNIAFPVIITVQESSGERIYAHKNIPIPDEYQTRESEDGYLNAIIARMDRENEPIPVEYLGRVIMLIHFGNPAEEQFENLMQQILETISFPVIITREVDGEVEVENHTLSGLDNLSMRDRQDLLHQTITSMDLQNEPVPVYFNGEVILTLHYHDSGIIRALQWFPLFELIIVASFILLGFAGFQFIRNAERRGIWVGMSKETAHQLGTPLSSLMGWLELLKGQELVAKTSEIVQDMETDVQRLYQVADRFSKIGAGVNLEAAGFNEVIDPVVAYIQRRIPQWGKSIEIVVDGDTTVQTLIHRELIGWALENLLKNAVDAIEQDEGRISITVARDNKFVSVDVADNGRGIAPRDHRNVFRPGWSSKQRGWGLGLSLVERIIREYHHGSISLSSTPGIGTTFHILLKLAPNP